MAEPKLRKIQTQGVHHITLGSRLIDGQSQNKTVAARAMTERKTLGHLS
jgi:hypothetical protein